MKDKFVNFVKDPVKIGLTSIIILATILRFYRLTNQSLWVDELHTMNEASPNIDFATLFQYLKCCDQHPPLYFFTERFFFTVFGYTEFVARAVSAICGVVSVYGMYLLGRTLADRSLGIIAALLTTINYYNIEYSQEARCYIMAMMFAIFSYNYFIRLIRDQNRTNIIWYSVFTVLMLYSHYYSLFIVASQGLIALVFLIGEGNERPKFFKAFLIAGIAILIGYAPWLPFLLTMTKIGSFWIGDIQGSFAIQYFNDYFGNNTLIYPFLILLLTYYCWQVFSEGDLALSKIKYSPLQLTFFVFIVSAFVTYLIPYLRSILVVPMLFNRYTIVLVPGFLIVLSLAFYQIKNRVARVTLLSIFVILTVVDLLYVKRFYRRNTIRKTQFRQMTEFISENKKEVYPIVEERTAWQHRYYLDHYKYNVKVLSGASKESIVTSILKREDAEHDLNGFWVVGAHGFEPKLTEDVRKSIDTAYTLVREKDFYDTWAQLYVRKNPTLANLTSYFGALFDFGSEQAVPLWGGPIVSQPIPVAKGEFVMTVMQRGTKAADAFPHITVYINDKKIGDFTTTEDSQPVRLNFTNDTEGFVNIKFDLDNDLMENGQDRNAFLKFITIEQVQ